MLISVDSVSLATLRMVAELLSMVRYYREFIGTSIFLLVQQVSQYSDINLMTSGTLATSCGPSFLPNLPASNANSIIKFLIDNCRHIFEN